MRYILVVALLVVVGSASAALGAKKGSREADTLAREVTAKAVYGSTNVLASVDACSLHIGFQSLNAAFDLPLQGTTVQKTPTADGIVVTNKKMTRTLNNRPPESFEQLTLRFHHDSIVPMLKTFENAIATCSEKERQADATR